MDDDEILKAYESIIEENIEYDYWMNDPDPSVRQRIIEIRNLILDVLLTKSKTIRIAKEEKNTEIVKSVFLKLTREHVSYVLCRMDENPSEIHNIKAYLLTVLYNAPNTMANYFVTKATHDIEHGLVGL